jgi:HAD superfamily hydrolase (TIGR01484 family)
MNIQPTALQALPSGTDTVTLDPAWFQGETWREMAQNPSGFEPCTSDQVHQMGREYESELHCVRSTVDWVVSLDLSAATAAFARLQCRNLIVVASGGSIAAAQFLAQLHSQRSGHIALVMTPLEFAADTHPLDAAAVFISSGGGNNDILRAWEMAAAREIQDVAAICGNSTSKLAALVKEARIAASVLFDLPSGRDGFLATNSLVAFFGIISRLYRVILRALPVRPHVPLTEGLLERETLVVLYGGWLKPVAVDLESRFTEAALGSVQIADYRNFAHGRHHWLAKRGTDTAVLALISPSYASLARDTLAEIPAGIPVERWAFDDESPTIALLGLQRSLELAAVAAARRGYDAGRPGVPGFGEHIYELKSGPQSRAATRREVTVARKQRACGLPSPGTALADELVRFEEALHEMKVSGVVLDYDGTIVATRRRFDAIDPEMAAELEKLLSSGLLIGIATGRGKSVHEKLRSAISQRHWSQCAVGYYNGGVIRTLAEPCDGLAGGNIDARITSAHSALRCASELTAANIETRPLQITVTGAEFDEDSLWKKVRWVLERSNLGDLKVVHSSHSVDVIPAEVSKAVFVEHLAHRAGVAESAILKVGDRGRWPGNDAELLAMSHGLSVDQVSGDPQSCWNLTPSGAIGPVGTLYYLRNIRNGRYMDT